MASLYLTGLELFWILERIANVFTVSGDSFNRPGCGAVRRRERYFPYIQLKTALNRKFPFFVRHDLTGSQPGRRCGRGPSA